MARNKFVLAMEDDLEVDPNQNVVPESAVEVEQGSAELTSDAGEVEELVAATEEAEADLETVEQLQEVAEDSVEQGEGLSEQSAEIAEIAIESIHARLGISRRVIPSLESFGSSNSRVAATRIAIEGFKDTVKRIWEAIKAAFARLMDKIKGFFMGLFKNTDSLSKHLENLKARVQQMDDGMKKDKEELSNGNLARAFSVKKKADMSTVDVIFENSKNLLQGAGKLSETVYVGVSSIKDLLAKEKSTIDDFKLRISDLSANIKTSMKSVTTAATSIGAGGIERNKEEDIDYYGPFASCRALAFKDIVKEKGTPNEYRIFSISMTTVDTFEADKIKALDKGEMLGLINKSFSLLDEVSKYKRAQAAVEKINSAVQDTAKVAISGLDKAADGDSEKGRLFRQVASEMNLLNSMTAALGVSIPKAAFDAVRYAAEYVSASMANYNQKK